ncbi:MAG: RES family NAD+ phosphorylase [Gemmatimonadaceae bacterium]
MTKGVRCWRIAADTPLYFANDLNGEGARITGGRWNRSGTPLIYASSSRALACLETIVHLAGEVALPLNRYLIEITVPESGWKRRRVFAPDEHVGWDALPAGRTSLDWGTRWAEDCETLIVEVPSIVVPEETNILINPRHRDISSITARKVRRWNYGMRL